MKKPLKIVLIALISIGASCGFKSLYERYKRRKLVEKIYSMPIHHMVPERIYYNLYSNLKPIQRAIHRSYSENILE